MPASPTITRVRIDKTSAIPRVPGGRCTVHASFSDASTKTLWSFYSDEYSYSETELVGLTEQAAWDLHHARDVMHLNS